MLLVEKDGEFHQRTWSTVFNGLHQIDLGSAPEKHLGMTISLGLHTKRLWRPWLLFLRGVCGHVALLAYLEALERIPLCEAVVLGKVHPMAAALLSYLFLGVADRSVGRDDGHRVVRLDWMCMDCVWMCDTDDT